jgi:hypothetical protein
MTARNATWAVLVAALGCLLAAPLCCPPAEAQGGPWLPAPGEFYSAFEAGFFSTDSYHRNDGEQVRLAFGGLLERRSLLSYNEIGWKKGASVILGIPVESVTRRSLLGEVNRTETGLSDLQLGLRFKVSEGASATALQLAWSAPAGYNRDYQISPAYLAYATATECQGLTGADSVNCVRQLAAPHLGSGEQEVSAVIHWGTALKRWNGFLEVSHGYRNRGILAAQALFSADLGFWIGPSLMVAGRYTGALDVGRGSTRGDDVDEHMAGPVVIYRLDDTMDVFASSLHTAVARNAFHTDRYFVGVAFKKTGLDRLQGYLGGTRKP